MHLVQESLHWLFCSLCSMHYSLQYLSVSLEVPDCASLTLAHTTQPNLQDFFIAEGVGLQTQASFPLASWSLYEGVHLMVQSRAISSVGGPLAFTSRTCHLSLSLLQRQMSFL